MTAAEIKRELSQYRDIHAECEQLRRHIDDKRKEIDRLREIAADDSTSATNADDTERVIGQMNKLIGRYTEKMLALESSEERALQMIDNVHKSDERSILFLYYIKNKPPDDIADELYISPRNVYYKHKRAIEQIEKMMNAEGGDR